MVETNRQFERRDARADATVSVPGQDRRLDAQVENISPGGARLKLARYLEKGQAISLHLGTFGEYEAEVMWVRQGKTGIRFTEDPAVMAELVMALAAQGG